MAKKRSRIYWRTQGGELRAYADLRDLGGGREALIAEGEKRATTDSVLAEALLGKRLEHLQEVRYGLDRAQIAKALDAVLVACGGMRMDDRGEALGFFMGTMLPGLYGRHQLPRSAASLRNRQVTRSIDDGYDEEAPRTGRATR